MKTVITIKRNVIFEGNYCSSACDMLTVDSTFGSTCDYFMTSLGQAVDRPKSLRCKKCIEKFGEKNQ